MVLEGRPGPGRGMAAGAVVALVFAARLWVDKASSLSGLYSVLVKDRVEVAILALPVILGAGLAGWVRVFLGRWPRDGGNWR